MLFFVFPSDIGIPLASPSLLPVLSSGRSEIVQRSSCFVHSILPRQWSPITPALAWLLLIASVSIGGKIRLHHCCSSEFFLRPEPIRSLQRGKSIAHGRRSRVLVYTSRKSGLPSPYGGVNCPV